jgi:hypothetical protein
MRTAHDGLTRLEEAMTNHVDLARKWASRTAKCTNPACGFRWTVSETDAFTFIPAGGQPDYAVTVKCPRDDGDARILPLGRDPERDA